MLGVASLRPGAQILRRHTHGPEVLPAQSQNETFGSSLSV
jgi:hypothetical protein